MLDTSETSIGASSNDRTVQLAHEAMVTDLCFEKYHITQCALTSERMQLGKSRSHGNKSLF